MGFQSSVNNALQNTSIASSIREARKRIGAGEIKAERAKKMSKKARLEKDGNLEIKQMQKEAFTKRLEHFRKKGMEKYKKDMKKRDNRTIEDFKQENKIVNKKGGNS